MYLPGQLNQASELDQPGSNRTLGANDSFGGKAGKSRFWFKLNFRGGYRHALS